MAYSPLLILALVAVIGQVYCQSRFNRNDRDRRDQIAEGCVNKVMDFYFILDSSSSIYTNDYTTERQFARDVISHFDVGPEKTRVGALTFSDDYQRPPLGLLRSQTKSDILASINAQNLPYRTGVTNTDQAIRYVRENNEFREDITKVMVVVTDGGSRSPGATAAEAALAREQGFYMFVVGIGQYLEEREWRAIASDPDENFLFNITNFQFLDSVKYSLPQRACSLPPIIVGGSCYVDQFSEVYFVASSSASDEAIQLIENFKARTRDDGQLVSLNYMIEKCNYATGAHVGDELDCDRDVPMTENTAGANDALLSRARNVARQSKESTRRNMSQTFVLFADEDTMRTNRFSFARVTGQINKINIIVVDLGLRNYRDFLQRLTAKRENIVSFLGGGLTGQINSQQSFIDRTCIAINTAPEPTFISRPQ